MVLSDRLVDLVAGICGISLGLGLWSTWVSLAGGGAREGSGRKADTLTRIAHLVRDVSPNARAILAPREDDPLRVAGLVIGPVASRVAAKLDSALGGTGDNSTLLTRAGVTWSIEEYHVRRLLLGLLGGAMGLIIGGLAGSMRAISVGALLSVVAAGIGVVVGAALVDYWLRRLARARQDRLVEEFPTVMELLALALAAGESLHGALARIAGRGSGELGREWARVLRLVELGSPLGPSLVESAQRLGVSEISALVDHLAAALERGAPLAEVVRSHSSDSRHQRMRSIVEQAGKAEVWMLVPLVMLILPVTVIFAVWPSLQALQFEIG